MSNSLLTRAEPKNYYSYILMGDIVHSKSIPEGKICERIESLFDELGNSFANWTSFNEARISTYPLGDGFVTVIIFFDKEGTEGIFKPSYTISILELCYKILLSFKLNKHINLRLAVHYGNVDCYNFQYTNGDNKINAFDYYIGDSIAECSRIMNFGDTNHLIVSEDFKAVWPRGNTVDKFDFRIQKFPDKKNQTYTFYTVHDRAHMLNLTNPTLKNSKPVIEDDDKKFFRKQIESCGLFYSTSVTDAKSWLNDQALLTVLLQQAVVSGGKNKDFRRLFIWEEEIQNSQKEYQKCLESHHDIAGVSFLTKSASEVQNILDTFNSSINDLPSEIIENPNREAWISCRKSCGIEIQNCDGCLTLEGGYGIWNEETERYEVVELSYEKDNIKSFKEFIIKLFDDK